MKKIQDFVVRGKDIFIGLEDSKRSWKVCVRSEGMIVHETSMPADYEVLRKYLQQKYPACRAGHLALYQNGSGLARPSSSTFSELSFEVSEKVSLFDALLF